jgi:serine/threonine protein kinase
MAGFEGTRLGAYELIKRTGRGGMAEVYLARQLTAFNREVAVKVIRAHFTEDPSFRERFLREAQAITKLSHPNILPLIEFGEEKGVVYLVMPLAREGTLRDLLKRRNGPLSLEEAFPLFTQLCDAVQYAHEQGIIHRDIKPQNVLLQSRTHVLLADFGIARDLGQTHITTTGAGIGTVEYMAPEQAMGQTDTRSDIYSLGVVLYQMLTGRVPYTGSTPFQVLMQHNSEPLPDPRQLNPNLPPEVVSVLHLALAKDPNQRFQSAQELGRAFQQVGPDATTLLISNRSAQRPIVDLAARQGKIETPPISTTALTQQATGQTPGPKESPSLYGSSRGAVGAGEPTVPGTGRRSNQPFSSGGNQPVNKERKGLRSLIVVLIAILLLIGAATSAGYAYFNRADQRPLTTSPTTRSSTAAVTRSPTPTATRSSTPTVTSKPKPTVTPAVTPTSTPTVSPTSAPTVTSTSPPAGGSQPVPFSVTGINVVADPSNFQGTCTDPMTFTFTATIGVPAETSGGTATYQWLQSDGVTGSAQTVNFNPGVTTQTVTTTRQLGAVSGDGSTFWEALQVTAPNSMISSHAPFSFACQFKVTSINASVSPTTYDCSQSTVAFNFSATITLSPGPNGGDITYTWERSDGTPIASQTTSVPAGQTTVTVTDTWNLGVSDSSGPSYWEQVVVTGPNSITSNQATFTKSC